MGLPTPRKCTGCKMKIKNGGHSFGKWGPTCTGPLAEGEGDSENSQVDATDKPLLQKLLDKVEQLEQAYNSGANPSRKSLPAKKNVTYDLSDSDDDVVKIDSMTTAQLKIYAKNLTKQKSVLKKKDKPESFLQQKQKDGPATASDLLEDDAAIDGRGRRSNIRQAAEDLTARNKDSDDGASSRIKDASVMADLRKDPRYRDTVDQFMNDIGERAAWFRKPGFGPDDRDDPRELRRRDPRESWDRRYDGGRDRLWDSRREPHEDYDKGRAVNDGRLLNKYKVAVLLRSFVDVCGTRHAH